MSNQSFTTMADVERYAAEHGITLNAKDRAQIGAAQRAALDEARKLYPEPEVAPLTFADRFNAFYPRLLAFVLAAGETVLTFAQTLLVSLGVPFVLVLLLIVEHHRVVEGIRLFDANPMFAAFAAAALVVANLVLEFTVHYVEQKAAYNAEREARWSLRIWLRNAFYTLGIGKQWTAQPLSPAARYHRLLRLVTFTILALALVGSMRTVIEQTPGRWYDALWSIVTESNLLLMGTWVSGLLFALAAVLTAQGLSRYVAIRCAEIIAAMPVSTSLTKREGLLNSSDLPFQADVDRAGAMAALALVNTKIEAKAEKRGVNSQPLTNSTKAAASSNGHGDGDFLAMPPMYQRDENDV